MKQKQACASAMLRQKLLADGVRSLSDAELLTFFLRAGRSEPAALATALLQRFGSVRGVLEADLPALSGESGVGVAVYARIQASMELNMRYLAEGFDRGNAISDPGTTREYLKGKLRAYGREVFACLYLDNQHRLIKYEELFFGTIDGASVHPREVVKRVLRHNAAAVIFAHNHPSGVAEPSQADRRITDRLKAALLLVDVRVLDHMIVGDQEVLSFAERGLL
jgi:DNA repair protein RadC